MRPARAGIVDEDTATAVDGAGGVTTRVIVLSLALAVFFGYVLPVVDFKLSNTFLGATHLPPGALAALLFLVAVVNPLLRLASKRFALRREESLTIYITCLFSSLVPGHGAENFFVPNLLAPFYYATSSNKWLDFLVPNLPSWFSPALREGRYGPAGIKVVSDWYLGIKDGPVPWGAWLVPLFAWGAVVLASYVMLACLSSMLRAQWAEREALAYPLLKLPLALVDGEEGGARLRGEVPLWRNGAAWAGVGLAVFIQLLNGLNVYFPDVPRIVLSLELNPYFSDPPWNQMGWTPLRTWPLVVAVTYLLPGEISFSLWAFYFIAKIELMASWAMGYPPAILPKATGSGQPAFLYYQKFGAYWMFVALILWTGREHWRHVFARAFGRVAARPAERHEALSYPAAFWGFALSFLFVVAWTALAGVRMDIAAYMWLAYLVIAVALSRMVAEAGLLFVQHGMRPLGAVSQIMGSGPGAFLPPSSIVPASFIQHSLMYDLRGFIMPSFVQSFKLARDENINLRRLTPLLFAVICITLFMGIWMRVRLGYENSGLTMNEWTAKGGAKFSASNALDYLNGPKDVGPMNPFWICFGMAVTWFLFFARSRWLWMPLHPAGYLMTLTFAMDMLWFSILLGWLFKTLISKYGGVESYRKAIPFFLGLALGEVSMMIFWLLVDGWFGRTGHFLMPD